MVFVYIRIYFAARDRARRQIRKSPRPRPQSSTTIEDTTSRNTGNSTPKIPPPSSSLKMITSPVELNVSPRPASPVTALENVPKAVKQVGFQEPLVSSSEPQEVVVKPEITVESCSPEDSTDVDAAQKESGSSSTSADNVVSACVNEVEVVDEKSDNSGGDNGDRGQESDDVIQSADEASQPADDNGEVGVKVEREMTAVDKEEEVSPEETQSANCQLNTAQEPRPLIPTIQLREALEDKVESAPSQQSTKQDEENRISDLQQSNGARRQKDDIATRRGKRPKLHFLRVEPPPIWRTSSSLSLNGDVHILGTLSHSCSRLQLDTDPVSDVEPSSSDSGAVSRCAVVKPLKLRLCQPFFGKKSNPASGKVRRDVMDTGRLPSPKVSSMCEAVPYFNLK